MNVFPESKYLIYEETDGVGLLCINRPEALNALNRDVLEELDLAVRYLEGNSSLSVLILTGMGKAFVAGADVAEISSMNAKEAASFTALGHRVFRALEKLRQPTLAAVNGFALGGGCELALCCDVIFASERAKFGQPEVGLGLCPGFGGTVRLPRRIGYSAAAAWIFSGAMYSAKEALDVGLVYSLHSDEALLAEAKKFAGLIASRAPLAVQECKKTMLWARNVDEETALDMEQQSFVRLFHTEDLKMGTRAFVEKQAPKFLGR